MRGVLYFLTALCAFPQSATFYLVGMGHGNVACSLYGQNGTAKRK